MESLPAEIYTQHIFPYLDDSNLRKSRAVCTRWSDLINYSNFTLYYTRPETLPDIVNTFSRYNKQIGLYFKHNVRLSETQLLSHIRTLSNLTSLKVTEIQEDSFTTDWLQLQYYTNLKLLDVTAPLPPLILKHIPNPSLFDNTDLLPVLCENTNIEELMLFSNKHLGETVMPLELLLNPSRLTNLTLDTINDNHDLERFTNLKNLYFRDYVDGYDGWSGGERLALWDPIKFSKVPSLEWLKSDAIKPDPDIYMNTNLTLLSIKNAQNIDENFVRSFSTLTKLQVLSLQISYLPSNWLSSLRLTNLACLKYVVDALDDGFTKIQVDMAKLTRLKLQYEAGFNFNTISHLTGLQRLDLLENENEEGDYEHCYAYYVVLSKLTNLTRLSVLSAAPLFRPFPIRYLQSLKRLELDAFDLAPDQIRSEMTNLESFKYAGHVNDIGGFKDLPNLTKLCFEASAAHDPRVLTTFSRLKKLDLFDGKIPEEWLHSILEITTLTSLSLRSLFKDENIKQLTVLSDLKELSIYYHHPCKAISCLTNLQKLVIYDVPLSSKLDVEESIKGLTRLWSVDLKEPEDNSDEDNGEEDDDDDDNDDDEE